MIKDPFIFKTLDVSTCHIPFWDGNKLDEYVDEGSPAPVYDMKEYGWIVYAGEIEDNWSEMSEEFKDVLRAAKELGCDYVRFDRDGRVYEDLPSFDW